MKNINIDFSGVAKQFDGLNGRHPGLWPTLPRMLLLSAFTGVLVLAGWYAYWSGLNEELEVAQQQEASLRQQYVEKVAKAVNLDDLRRQKVLAEQYVGVLEKQLPSRAEMDALLSDINQAGVGRGAKLELFRPGVVQAKQHYAELPIEVMVSGGFNDLASFSSDLANLPRIVTLNNIKINHRGDTNNLEMKATVKTYRYLEKDELAAARTPKAGGK